MATYLEEALCADIDACAEARDVAAVADMLGFLLAQGKLKKELGGHELPTPHKKSVRTALNRATKRLAELEAAQRAAQRESAPPRPAPRYEMERDVRLRQARAQAS